MVILVVVVGTSGVPGIGSGKNRCAEGGMDEHLDRLHGDTSIGGG